MDETMMVQVEDLNKTEGEGVLLSEVSFETGAKGIHGILGPRYSGKTELLEILAGIDQAWVGFVSVDGMTYDEDPIRYKKKIGYLPASDGFDPGLCAEEILELTGRARGVAAEKRARQITEALDLVGLTTVRRRLVRNLRTAELRRLALAAALMGNPELLLLDDPMTGMKRDDREEMMGLVRMLGRMKTVILATEDFETARALCHDVVLLCDGRILVTGSFDELEEKLRRQGEGSVPLSELYRALATPAGEVRA